VEYTTTTQEYLFLHFNYVKEEQVRSVAYNNKHLVNLLMHDIRQQPNNLVLRSHEEVLTMTETVDRLRWCWVPFDVVPAAPCGQPNGGHCPR
jgi:hypothetical protein